MTLPSPLMQRLDILRGASPEWRRRYDQFIARLRTAPVGVTAPRAGDRFPDVALPEIARYKWIDRLRALARDPATPGVDGELDALSVGDHGAAVTSALVLRELLDRLKPTQAMVIRLVKLDGLSIEEASVITGQSLSLVKVNIHRGLTKLRGFVEASA